MSKQDIYNTLIKSGMTREAVLGMMGNMQCESGLEAGRLQGDFNAFRTSSKSYVARVTSGDIKRDSFALDGFGFGLCQWTFHSRKRGLYDFWKESGTALDDAEMQARFCVKELKENYHNLWDLLCTSHDIYTCTKEICVVYERPARNNIDQRFTAAVSLKAELLESNPKTDPEPKPVEPVKEVYWPPRMICKGMAGDDVAVLQAVLQARGYSCEITGDFDVKTHNMTIAFQAEKGLVQDGIAGPLTFRDLLDTGR